MFIRFCLFFFSIFFAILPLNGAKIVKTNYSQKARVSLVLYIRPSCPHSVAVLSTLDKLQKKIPIKDITNNPALTKELIAIGGKRQVPCLVINGRALYESSEIIKWLKDHRDLY